MSKRVSCIILCRRIETVGLCYGPWYPEPLPVIIQLYFSSCFSKSYLFKLESAAWESVRYLLSPLPQEMTPLIKKHARDIKKIDSLIIGIERIAEKDFIVNRLWAS